ncbi:alpha/beta fold hydrolase [Celeribacter sp. ULVN23_4]
MTRIFPAFIASSLCLTAPAFATETLVTVPAEAGKVIGTYNDADGTPDTPVVLFLHGFTGSRDELPVAGTEEGVFSRSARVLAEAGYPSLRIDFIGSGESTDKTWEETTFSGQIATVSPHWPGLT